MILLSARQSQALGLEVSLSSLSREFGMSRETISKRLMAAGIQPSGRNRGNDVFRVGAAARAIVSADYGCAAGPVIDPSTLGPKDFKDYWGGKNEELKFERESGQVIDLPDHEDAVADLAKVLIHAIETIPDMLEQRYGLDADQLEAIEATIDDARARLAEKLSELVR